MKKKTRAPFVAHVLESLTDVLYPHAPNTVEHTESSSGRSSSAARARPLSVLSAPLSGPGDSDPEGHLLRPQHRPPLERNPTYIGQQQKEYRQTWCWLFLAL